MKLLIISDIHGSAAALQTVLDTPFPVDHLILAGDSLYHGPRNPILDDYDPAQVATLLNQAPWPRVAVRGNCDAEVDQMLLDFPMMQDYSMAYFNDLLTCISHGHLFDPHEHARSAKCSLYITGHTHLPVLEENADYIMLNPGSISLPKGGHPATYAYFTPDAITLYTLDHHPYMTLAL